MTGNVPAATAVPTRTLGAGMSVASPLGSPHATARPTVRDGEAWIVYQGGTPNGEASRIRLVRPDGSGDHVLIDGLAPNNPNGWYMHPDWSHDGRRIAFVVEDGDDTSDIWVVNVDGTGAEKVFDCVAPCGIGDDPNWSPDDARIAFILDEHANGAGSRSRLAIVDLAAGAVTTVLDAPELAWFYHPRWAPDGHRLVLEATRFATPAFDEDRAVDSTIGTVDLAAKKPSFSPLFPFASKAQNPDWSARSDVIVYQVTPDFGDAVHSSEVWIVALGDGANTEVTNFGDAGFGLQPTWVPDGSRIIFVSPQPDDRPNASFIGADGRHFSTLPSDGFFRTHPRLRPLR
jgi:Tol biopolymer transport system component